VSALRILVTADAVGGVWTYATDLAAGVAEAEVIIAVFGPAPRPVQRRQGAGLDVVETGLPLDWMARTPREVLAAAARLQRLVAELRPDVVHLNSPALAAAGPLGAPTLGVCHSCVATWWAAVKGGPMPADFRWRTELLRDGLARCDIVAAPSHSFAGELAATYRVATPVVVHNGRARPAPVEVDREPIVLTVGRLWDEGKNVATLDAAAAACAAPLYAAGPLESPDGASRARLAHARPLGARSADSVAAWMARASIFASAALYEPFGLGVLEAAQAGCALVLSDIATFRELWDGAAIFADPRDPGAFAAAFEALTRDPGQAARLGEAARARAVRFSLEAMCVGARRLYRRLANERAAA